MGGSLTLKMKIELTLEQALEVHYALLVHTKHDSVEFPSARVALLREAIGILGEELEKVSDSE